MKNLNKLIYLLQVLFIVTISLHGQTIRIMPLGDSITHGWGSLANGGYRGYLWNKLKDASYDVDFVGSQYRGSGLDADHEGYDGIKTYEIEEMVYGLLQDNAADIILLHIGSNDVSPNQNNSSSIIGLRDILDEIDRYEVKYKHSIRVILATIIQRTSYHQTLRDYNENLKNLANSRIANGDKITLVDMEYGAGLNSSDYADSVHPNSSGYNKMSNVWFNALTNLLPPPQSPIPNDPSELVIIENADNMLTLQWSDNANNESGFQIYQDGVLIETVSTDVSSYTLENLAPNTTYTYTLVAYNAVGTSDPVSVTFTTKDDYGWLPAVYHVILN